jgi:hypothetical protein
MLFSRSIAGRALLAAASTAAVGVLLAGPASAATDDSFKVSTANGCGVANFVDYGAGAAGGGNNDDYIVIHDYCSDGHGVRAYATLKFGDAVINLGSQYNGNGLAGAAVIWDPFKEWGNVIEGDIVTITVCLVDGASDTTGSGCVTGAHTSVDGSIGS